VNAIWRVKDGKTLSKCEKKTTKSTTDGEQRADGGLDVVKAGYR